MKVDKDEFGSRRPKLTVDDLDGDAGVLTIATVEKETVEGEDGKRVSLVLTFEETGDKSHWLNSSQVGYLIERLGDESDEWVGKVIPIERHDSTYRGKKFEKLWVSAPERWDAIFKEAGVEVEKKPARRVGRVGTVKTARKVAKKGKR